MTSSVARAKCQGVRVVFYSRIQSLRVAVVDFVNSFVAHKRKLHNGLEGIRCMIRGLFHSTHRQCSPVHVFRQVLSTSAVAGYKGFRYRRSSKKDRGTTYSATSYRGNWAYLRISKKDPGDDAFESDVKRRVLETEISLDMPQAQQPSSKDIERWRRVLQSPSIESLSKDDYAKLTSMPLPPWILMYLLVTKTRSPSQAILALDIIYTNLYHSPESVQPHILILATRILAKLKVEPPMDRIVHTFLELSTNRLHFNLLLRTMSRFRPSVHTAKLTTMILDTMQARQLLLSRATYTSLLYNRFVTLEITKRLQARMRFDGVKPNAKQIELFLRCFGKLGAFRSSTKYVKFIRQMQLAQNKSEARELTAERYPATAFEYLRSLVDDETILASTIEEEQKLVEHSVRNRSLVHGKPKGPGHSGWTAALHIAARDKRVSSDGLLVLFERTKKAGLAPTLATYTVVIRGLVRKSGDYTGSLKLWREQRRTVRLMDAAAMTVGMDVLIGSGRALEAFDLLIEQSARWNIASRRISTAERDTALLNAFMSALEEHGWPTAVFYCWDALEALFGVRPDAISLTILLRAAQDAERADGSIRGLLGHIGMYNPFRSGDTASVSPTSPLSTSELESRIRSCLRDQPTEGDEKSDTTDTVSRTRTSSLWSGTPAGPKALELFRSVVLGNFPHLRELKAPAKAVWSDSANEASPLRDVARGLGLVTRQKPTVTVPSSNRFFRSFPQISPDERTFHAYIALLGSQRRSSEIPLALTWMRGLELVPRKETVSLALVLFGEVSLRGPLLESYGSMSEYKKLIAWLKAWLGEDKLPNEGQLRRTFRYLQRDRGGMINEEGESP